MGVLAYREVHAMNRVQARKHPLQIYQETGGISETARRWHTSRQVAREWIRRFDEEGEEGLRDRSLRLYRCPKQTSPEVEQEVLESSQATNYGRERLALCSAPPKKGSVQSKGCTTSLSVYPPPKGPAQTGIRRRQSVDSIR